MRDLATRALNQAELAGASYADIRFVAREIETVSTKARKVDNVRHERSFGFGVRVLLGGAWGFSSSGSVTAADVGRVVDEALAIAKASALAGGAPVDLGPAQGHRGFYATPLIEDPFAVPLEEKIATLLEAEARMASVPGVTLTMGSIGCQREHKHFFSTEGAAIEQILVETGCGIEAVAAGAGEVQVRSYPNSFGRQQTTEGYELVRRMDLVGNAARVAEEAVALLAAPPVPEGETTLILDPTQLALQIHESIGHAIELDRVYGFEAAYAGTSFLSPRHREDGFRYGSEIVNVAADATLPGGLGTFGYDDEGVPAQRVPIIEAGVFKGFLSCRETASRLGVPSGGTARADSWRRIPMVRMTNVSLEPGEWTLERMIADTEQGVYMETNRSWSIDDKRLNFQFGCQLAYEIKDGKRGRLLKNGLYTGLTPRFWASCDAIANRDHWQIWGTPNCGKGQPLQVGHVGHGASPARFRGVTVGAG